MPYAPGITYETGAFGQSLSNLGQQISSAMEKRKEDAKKAKALRSMMGIYDPEGADRYHAMGLDQLEAEYQAQALKRAEEARKLDLAYKQAQIDASARSGAWTQAQIGNMAADNARADEALKLSKQQASDAKWSGIRRDAQTWWDRTMQAKRLSDHDAALAKPPTVVDLDGNPYAFQAGTGHMQPLLNRNELTAQQRARSTSDLTGKLASLATAFNRVNPNDPTAKSQRRMLGDEISRTRKTLDAMQSPDSGDGGEQESQTSPESSPAPAPPPGDNETMAKQARAAIARGANLELVKKRYKEMTGQDLKP